MLFVTNRAIQLAEDGHTYTLPIKDNTVGQSVTFSRRFKKNVYQEIGSYEFFRTLKSAPHRQILLYIHGFNNLPESEIFPRTAELQGIMNELAGDDFVLVVPVIWPCDSDFGIIKDYWDDQKSADASAFAFSRVFQKFLEWRDADENIKDPCLKRINVLAHSMGNRVLRQTLNAWNKYDGVAGVPLLFRNTFLVASDIVNESLESGKDAQYIPQASRNVMVFYASDDLALRGSKISNVKNRVASRRLGHTGPEDMRKVPNNVYGYDCDGFNNQFDMPTGHTYFFRKSKTDPTISPVAYLMCYAMKTGRAFTTLPQLDNQKFIVDPALFENADFVGRLYKLA